MSFRLMADLLVGFHFLCVLFIVGGGLLVLRWPRLAWIHVPCAIWGAWVEFANVTCPLTPLENRWRRLAGEAGYAGGFVDHYLIPLIYPEQLERSTQWILGSIVVIVNGLAYLVLFLRWRREAAR